MFGNICSISDKHRITASKRGVHAKKSTSGALVERKDDH